MDEEQLSRLVEAVYAVANRPHSRDHGDAHWRAVAWTGLRLLPDVPTAQPLVVLLFALFHDAKRENEYTDPEHGLRGAELSRRLHGQTNLLPHAAQELLYVACRDHTGAPTSDDPTIGACFDSDRLNLWRVGIAPSPKFLSTAPARDPELIREAATFHGRAPEWPDLVRAYLEVDAPP